MRRPCHWDRCRRDFLHLGVLTSFGLSLSGLLRLQAAAAETGKSAVRAKSCILIWLDGGPSHPDLFDLKPDAPSEVRSQFKAIGTGVSPYAQRPWRIFRMTSGEQEACWQPLSPTPPGA